MIEYLSEEEIIEINRLCLELTDELNEFIILQHDDIRFLIKFVTNNFDSDVIKKSLVYCISIIVLHPFKNGNHRTSLLAAEHFLLKNNFISIDTDEKDLEIQKWRINFEEKHNLEKEFFQIACIEDEKKKTIEIIKIINSEYGKNIEKWLKENFTDK